jgi:hypothetical protein
MYKKDKNLKSHIYQLTKIVLAGGEVQTVDPGRSLQAAMLVFKAHARSSPSCQNDRLAAHLLVAQGSSSQTSQVLIGEAFEKR